MMLMCKLGSMKHLIVSGMTTPVTEHQQAKNLDDLQQQDELLPPEHYDIGQDLGLTTDVDQIVQVEKEMSDNDFRSKMRQINTEQTKFLYSILNLSKTSNQPYKFLTGGAGVGKTFVIKLLYQALLKYFNVIPGTDPNLLNMLLMAPTGKAAYLICGNTVHSALMIPINQSFDFKSLDIDRLNTLPHKWKL